MKILNSFLLLVIVFYLSSCTVDCEVEPVFIDDILNIRVPNDGNHSEDEDIKFLGIGKGTDTLTAWKYFGQSYYDYETNETVYDSTYIIYHLYLPIDKKNSNSAFQIFYRNQIDTISFTYSSVLKERRLGSCNTSKFTYEISNFKIDKITFDTIQINPNESQNYYYSGSILADFQ